MNDVAIGVGLEEVVDITLDTFSSLTFDNNVSSSWSYHCHTA